MIVAGTRMLLERSIRRYLSNCKSRIRIRENNEVVEMEVEDASLKQLIEYLYRRVDSLPISKEIKKSLRRFAEADQTQVASLATLNNIFHASRSMTPSDAKEIWKHVCPMIEYFACQNTKNVDENNLKELD